MIFVPSIGGRSHVGDESTAPEDLALGVDALTGDAAGSGRRGVGSRPARGAHSVAHDEFFICGSALRGQPDHGKLGGARFVREAKTKPRYACTRSTASHPGYLRGFRAGVAIAGEVYEMTDEQHAQAAGRRTAELVRGRWSNSTIGTQVSAMIYPRRLIEERGYEDISITAAGPRSRLPANCRGSSCSPRGPGVTGCDSAFRPARDECATGSRRRARPPRFRRSTPPHRRAVRSSRVRVNVASGSGGSSVVAGDTARDLPAQISFQREERDADAFGGHAARGVEYVGRKRRAHQIFAPCVTQAPNSARSASVMRVRLPSGIARVAHGLVVGAPCVHTDALGVSSKTPAGALANPGCVGCAAWQTAQRCATIGAISA